MSIGSAVKFSIPQPSAEPEAKPVSKPQSQPQTDGKAVPPPLVDAAVIECFRDYYLPGQTVNGVILMSSKNMMLINAIHVQVVAYDYDGNEVYRSATVSSYRETPTNIMEPGDHVIPYEIQLDEILQPSIGKGKKEKLIYNIVANIVQGDGKVKVAQQSFSLAPDPGTLEESRASGKSSLFVKIDKDRYSAGSIIRMVVDIPCFKDKHVNLLQASLVERRYGKAEDGMWFMEEFCLANAVSFWSIAEAEAPKLFHRPTPEAKKTKEKDNKRDRIGHYAGTITVPRKVLKPSTVLDKDVKGVEFIHHFVRVFVAGAKYKKEPLVEHIIPVSIVPIPAMQVYC